MSLNDDWKAGKLRTGWYYNKFQDGTADIDFFDEDDDTWLCNSDKDYVSFEVIQPVPTYAELANLETKLEMAQVQNAELKKTNASLSSQIKHLLDLQKEEDKEIERLIELLKECYPYVNKEFEKQTMKTIIKINL